MPRILFVLTLLLFALAQGGVPAAASGERAVAAQQAAEAAATVVVANGDCGMHCADGPGPMMADVGSCHFCPAGAPGLPTASTLMSVPPPADGAALGGDQRRLFARAITPPGRPPSLG